MADKLRQYAELRIHEINLNANIGASPVETLTSIEAFATEVMPHFTNASEVAVSRRSQLVKTPRLTRKNTSNHGFEEFKR